jgi:hypothetical protein
VSVLQLHARRVSVDDEPAVAFISFEGDGADALLLMAEDEEPAIFRMWLNDARHREDEELVALLAVEVEVGRVRIHFDLARSPTYRGPYEHADVQFDDQDAEETSALLAAMRVLFRDVPEIVHVSIPGLPKQLPDTR